MKTAHVLLLIILFCSPLYSQWNPDPRQNTPIDTSQNIKNVRTTMYAGCTVNDIMVISDSLLWIVWLRVYAGGPFWPSQFLTQTISTNGIKRWGVNGTAITDTIKGSIFGIAYDQNGGIYLVYLKTGKNYIPTAQVHIRRINKYGLTLWEHSEPQSIYASYEPRIISDSRGGAFITWYNTPDSCYVQRYDSSGNRAWRSPKYIGESGQYGVLNPFNFENHGYIFCTYNQWNNPHIYRIDSNATVRTVTFPDSLRDPSFFLTNNLIRSDEDSFFFVYLIDSTNIFIRKYNVQLNDIWNQRRFVIGNNQTIRAMQAIPDMKKGVILCWSDDTKISCMRIDSAGDKKWSQPVVVPNNRAPNDMRYGKIIVSDSSGGIIICYARDSSYITSIYAQRIDSSGAMLWGTNGVLLSSITDYKTRMNVISDKEYGAYLVWLGLRNTPPYTESIYATRIRPNGAAYPVELSSFAARLAGERVLLEWATASETNNCGFEVERASSSLSAPEGTWRRIGFVAGNGTTTAAHEYSYEDPLTPALLSEPLLYYRLRQVDCDGTAQYSPVAVVQLASAPAGAVLHAPYPNPAVTSASLSFTLPEETEVRLSVRDALGREVAVPASGLYGAGYHPVSFSTANLPPGVYLCVLQAGGVTRMEKVVILGK